MQASLGICPAGIAPSTAIYDNDSVKNNQFMIGKKEAEKEAENETATATTTETASLGCLPPPPTLPLPVPSCLPWLVGLTRLELTKYDMPRQRVNRIVTTDMPPSLPHSNV